MATKFNLSVVIRAVDRAAAPLNKLNAKVQSLTGPVRRLNNRFRALGRAAGVGKLTKAVGRLGSRLAGVGAAAAQVGRRIALIGGAAAGSLFVATKRVAELGDEAIKTGRRLGVTAEFLQEMRFAADRSGVSQKVFDKSLEKFTVSVGEARRGLATYADAFKELDIDLVNTDGSAKGVDEIFTEVADRLGPMTDKTKQASIAYRIFGARGVKLTQIMGDGAEGMNKLREEARKFGGVISTETAAQSETFLDRLTDLKAAFSGVTNIIGSEMLPAVTDIFKRLTTFLVENQTQIKAWAKQFARDLPGALKRTRDFVVALIDRLGPMIATIAKIVDFLGPANSAILLFATTIGGPLTRAITGLIPAVLGLGKVLLLTPIGQFVTLLGIIVFSAVRIRNAFKQTGASISEVFQGLGALILKVLLTPIKLVLFPLEKIVELLTGRGLFERVADLAASIPGIGGFVQRFFGGDPSGGAGPAVGAGARAPRAAGVVPPGAAGANGRVAVDVNFENVPRGVNVGSKSEGGGVDLTTEQGLALSPA